MDNAHAIVPLVFTACAGSGMGIGPPPVCQRYSMVTFPLVSIPLSFLRVIEHVSWLSPLRSTASASGGRCLTGILVLLYRVAGSSTASTARSPDRPRHLGRLPAGRAAAR